MRLDKITQKYIDAAADHQAAMETLLVHLKSRRARLVILRDRIGRQLEQSGLQSESAENAYMDACRSIVRADQHIGLLRTLIERNRPGDYTQGRSAAPASA